MLRVVSTSNKMVLPMLSLFPDFLCALICIYAHTRTCIALLMLILLLSSGWAQDCNDQESLVSSPRKIKTLFTQRPTQPV